MGSKRERSDFIGFISDVAGDRKLMEEFRSKKTADEIYKFFQDNGYTDIDKNDCGSILTARDGVEDQISDSLSSPAGQGPVKSY